MPESFFVQFELENQGEGGKIKVKNKGSNQEITVQYFTCKKGDAQKDCDALEKRFSTSSEKSFQTINGVVLYKLYEVKSRFARSKYRGYFINDAGEQEVAGLAQHLQVINNTLIKNSVIPHIGELCSTQGEEMMNVDKQSLTRQGDALILSLEGKSQ
ncbi:MAG: hypothetical protein GXP45_05520 [bacterium]|nr:hypothetical protein [bacterium]